MHSAIREAYNRCTNRRDVATQVWLHCQCHGLFTVLINMIQILCVDHHMLALKLIRQSINSQDIPDDEDLAESASATLNTNKDSGSESAAQIPNSAYQPSTLGSRCTPVLMQTFEMHNPKDGPFSRLRKKFTEFLNSLVHAWGYEHVNYIKIPPTFEVSHLASWIFKQKVNKFIFPIWKDHGTPISQDKIRINCWLARDHWPPVMQPVVLPETALSILQEIDK